MIGPTVPPSSGGPSGKPPWKLGKGDAPGAAPGSPDTQPAAINKGTSPLFKSLGIRVEAPPPVVAPDVSPDDSSESEALELPRSVINYIKELEKWAQDNKKDEEKDRVKFWSLKVPAVLASILASVGITPLVTTVVAIISGICIALDGFIKPGMLRNVHHRAFFDLRGVQLDMRDKWTIGCLDKEDKKSLEKKIVEYAMSQRNRIQQYLMDAETRFGAK